MINKTQVPLNITHLHSKITYIWAYVCIYPLILLIFFLRIPRDREYNQKNFTGNNIQSTQIPLNTAHS